MRRGVRRARPRSASEAKALAHLAGGAILKASLIGVDLSNDHPTRIEGSLIQADCDRRWKAWKSIYGYLDTAARIAGSGPQYLRVARSRLLAYMAQGQWETAAAYVESFLPSFPRDAWLLQNAAICAIALDRFEVAAERARRASVLQEHAAIRDVVEEVGRLVLQREIIAELKAMGFDE